MRNSLPTEDPVWSADRPERSDDPRMIRGYRSVSASSAPQIGRTGHKFSRSSESVKRTDEYPTRKCVRWHPFKWTFPPLGTKRSKTPIKHAAVWHQIRRTDGDQTSWAPQQSFLGSSSTCRSIPTNMHEPRAMGIGRLDGGPQFVDYQGTRRKFDDHWVVSHHCSIYWPLAFVICYSHRLWKWRWKKTLELGRHLGIIA
jgi:hypothetical protein